MTVIYSNDDIGVQGAYIAPIYFDAVVKGATVVYAEDKAIIEAYKAVGIDCLPFKKGK